MSNNYEIVLFKLRRDSDGLYTVTSPDLAGVCLVHRDKARIIDDIPNIVRLWYRRHRGVEVEVFSGRHRESDDTVSIPTMTIPAEIAAQHLSR